MSDAQKISESVTDDPQKGRASCTHHCGSCGRHFSSLKAFDAHRVGEFEAKSTIEGRHCVGLEFRESKVAKQFKARTGVCDLTKSSGRLHDQPIWGSSETLDKGVFNA